MSESRTCLITGAASGIGAALALRLAGPAVNLMLHTRGNAEGLHAAAEQARSRGAHVSVHLSDLSEQDAAQVLVQQTIAEYGGLDCVVSNAGYADRTALMEVDAARLQQAFAAMASAFLGLMQAASPALRQSDCARVVAVSSFVNHRFNVSDHFPASAAAKAALESLVRSSAARLASDGICVNAVVPGYVRKSFESNDSAEAVAARRPGLAHVPLGRVAEPDEIAAVIEFLLSPGASYVTGECWHVSGGMLL